MYSHGAFAEHLGGLPYELIADFERSLVDSWGVRRTDLEGYDGVPRRSVFILDPERKVRWRWVTKPEQRLPDVAQVLTEARKVATESAKKVVKKVTKDVSQRSSPALGKEEAATSPARPQARRQAKAQGKPQAKTTGRLAGKPTRKPGGRSTGSEGRS